jgi:hypothetical protein
MSSRLRLGFHQVFQVNNIRTVALWQTVIGYFPTKRAITGSFLVFIQHLLVMATPLVVFGAQSKSALKIE